ncbi:MAG: HNH endonuclease [Pseudomonadota bacterium]
MSHRILNNLLLKNRLLAFKKQKGCCYYCGLPMWLGNVVEFAGNYGIRENHAKRLQCTAEHLIARQDGGTDERNNIVAACSFCNSTRHKALRALSPKEYQKKVKERLRHQKWHPRELHQIL